MHNSVANVVLEWCRCAGFSSHREVVVPEWAQWSHDRQGNPVCNEAILDIEASRPWLAETLHIDVTVRNPATARYLREADGCSSSNTNGHALQIAAAEKHKRYPPRSGIMCTPAAVEIFGRVGPEFLDLMDHLAAAAATHDVDFGMPAVGWRRKWEERLSIVVQKSLARSFVDALGSATSGPSGMGHI